MAEELEINRLLANGYEPKRVFEWVLEIDGLDSFVAKTAERPKKNHEDITIDWINEKRFLAGKGEWQPIQIALYDPISPSAAAKVYEWLKLVHNDATGRMNYASVYKKNFKLKILDPRGRVVEQWTCVGGWPKEINFSGNGLDYSSSDALTVEFQLRADKWFLDF